MALRYRALRDPPAISRAAAALGCGSSQVYNMLSGARGCTAIDLETLERAVVDPPQVASEAWATAELGPLRWLEPISPPHLNARASMTPHALVLGASSFVRGMQAGKTIDIRCDGTSAVRVATSLPNMAALPLEKRQLRYKHILAVVLADDRSQLARVCWGPLFRRLPGVRVAIAGRAFDLGLGPCVLSFLRDALDVELNRVLGLDLAVDFEQPRDYLVPIEVAVPARGGLRKTTSRIAQDRPGSVTFGSKKRLEIQLYDKLLELDDRRLADPPRRRHWHWPITERPRHVLDWSHVARFEVRLRGTALGSDRSLSATMHRAAAAFDRWRMADLRFAPMGAWTEILNLTAWCGFPVRPGAVSCSTLPLRSGPDHENVAQILRARLLDARVHPVKVEQCVADIHSEFRSLLLELADRAGLDLASIARRDLPRWITCLSAALAR